MYVNPYYSQALVGAMDNISGNIQSLTNELSSGSRLSSIADDPSASAESIALASQAAADTQFVQSATAAESKLQITDTAIGNVVTQMTQAIALATQGITGTSNASDRAAVAKQLAGIRDEVLSLANSSYLGSYVFAGSATGTQPFTLDNSTTPATVTYYGNSNTVYENTPSGGAIATGFSGDALFGSGTGVLSSLNTVIADLSAATLPASAQSDAQALSSAMGALSSARVSVGASLSHMQAASGYAGTEATELAAENSTLTAADYSAVSTALKSAETQQEALYTVVGTLGQNNLFSFLKG